MIDGIENVLDEAFNKIDDNMISDDNLTNDISNLVHEQNEKITKDVMRREILQSLDDLKASGVDVYYTDDMSYDELEEIIKVYI